jgi:hypothetical protein
MLPVPTEAAIFKRLNDGAVIYHCTEEVYFGLNDEGARLWELLPTVRGSLDDLVARMATEHPDVEIPMIRRDAQALMASLEKFGLVRSADKAPA